MMLRAGCEMGLRVCLKGLLQQNRGVLVFPGRKIMEVFERCKGQGWRCPHLDHMDNVESDQ